MLKNRCFQDINSFKRAATRLKKTGVTWVKPYLNFTRSGESILESPHLAMRYKDLYRGLWGFHTWVSSCQPGRFHTWVSPGLGHAILEYSRISGRGRSSCLGEAIREFHQVRGVHTWVSHLATRYQDLYRGLWGFHTWVSSTASLADSILEFRRVWVMPYLSIPGYQASRWRASWSHVLRNY